MTGVALITGGQQGIGLGIALSLRDAGFKIALASRSEVDKPAVNAALTELGPNSAYFVHDVQNVSGVSKLINSVERRFGSVTTLISNAGVPAKVRGDMLEVLPDNFDFVMNVNLRGAFFLAQEVARRMLYSTSNDYKSILFITSVSATMVSIERAEYCISKAGAAMMAELFAVRLAPKGIGVFELRPGIIETEMTAGVKDKYTQRIEGGLVPAGRWGKPSDIGDVVVPMVTGRMAFANGAIVPVDGGLSIAQL